VSAASASAAPADPLTTFLASHPTPEPPAELSDCTDVRAVVSIVLSALRDTARRRALDSIAKVSVLSRISSPHDRGEIAVDWSGWGNKSFADPDGTKNEVAIIVRCADLDTCRAVATAAIRPPSYASGDAALVPFLVCGAPVATYAWGRPQLIREP
jgi:hypothetical protein